MKKTYISPLTEEIWIESEALLCSSGVTGDDDFDIGFGGLDDGSQDPEAPGLDIM